MSEKKIISFEELLSGPSQIVKINTGQLLDIAAQSIEIFTEDCMKMAEQNWTPNQVKQLEWLFGAVLSNKSYGTYAFEQIKEAEQ